ncbi:unnamed protein product, partial [Rotaria magnacalcarata]
MRDYSNALSFYQQAIEICRNILSPIHPDLASVYNNIGLTYDNMEEYAKALSYHEKAIEIRQKLLPLNE